MPKELLKKKNEIKLLVLATCVSFFGAFVCSLVNWSYSIVLFFSSLILSALLMWLEKMEWQYRIVLIFINSILIFSSALGMKTTFNSRSEIGNKITSAFYKVLNISDPSAVVVSLPMGAEAYNAQIQQAKRIIKTEKDLNNFKEAISIMETNPRVMNSRAVIQYGSASPANMPEQPQTNEKAKEQ